MFPPYGRNCWTRKNARSTPRFRPSAPFPRVVGRDGRVGGPQRAGTFGQRREQATGGLQAGVGPALLRGSDVFVHVEEPGVGAAKDARAFAEGLFELGDVVQAAVEEDQRVVAVWHTAQEPDRIGAVVGETVREAFFGGELAGSSERSLADVDAVDEPRGVGANDLALEIAGATADGERPLGRGGTGATLLQLVKEPRQRVGAAIAGHSPVDGVEDLGDVEPVPDLLVRILDLAIPELRGFFDGRRHISRAKVPFAGAA